ncbi:MAG: hypothetical protein HOE90_10170 [Bacteriovoracaceae bacterium]|nr:hypothetical protein [Bacteriovoracaceae bacterium]
MNLIKITLMLFISFNAFAGMGVSCLVDAKTTGPADVLEECNDFKITIPRDIDEYGSMVINQEAKEVFDLEFTKSKKLIEGQIAGITPVCGGWFVLSYQAGKRDLTKSKSEKFSLTSQLNLRNAEGQKTEVKFGSGCETYSVGAD